MKIVHLTSAHSCFDVRIFYKECRSLAKAGYNVTIILPEASCARRDDIGFVAVGKGTSRVERFIRRLWRLYAASVRENAEIYHIHDPDLIVVGFALKVKGKKVIYDAHEDLPRQVLDKTWIAPSLRNAASGLAKFLERLAGRWFDGIVVAAPVIGLRFPREKVALVRNYPRLEDFPETERLPQSRRPNWLLYNGSITESRGAREMVLAMSHLPESLDAKLILAGTINDEELLLRLRSSPGWHRVDFRGWQDRAQINELLCNVRIGLHLLHPIAHYIDQPYGVKVFEFMAAGIPSIMSNFPVWKEFVDCNSTGLTANPLDPRAIAQKIVELLQDPLQAQALGTKARKSLEQLYSWSSEEAELLAMYRRISSQQRAHGE